MAVTASLPAAKSRFGVSLPLLVALVAFIAVLANASGLLGDPDTYWHIVVGRWSLAHHAAAHADIFSNSKPGAPWVPHEWLTETIFAPLYDGWGWNGPVLITALSLAATLAILTRALLRWLEPVHAFAAVVATWGLILAHLLARPHILTLPIMVLWFAALVEARERDRAPTLWFAAVMTVWANLHGGYVLGLAFAALFAGEALLAAPNRSARIVAVRQWGAFGALSLAAPLLMPNGFAGWWLPFHLLSMKFALSVLVEWQSPNFQTIQPLEIWFMVALALGFGGYLIFSGVKPFIDGRTDMYGDDFVKRYVEVTRGITGELPAMLDQYHAAWTLFAAKSPAATLMDHLTGWNRVYADNTAVIHARADSAR